MPTITGTTGNDTLNGTSGDDTINGLGGNDTIDGSYGNDTIDGGDGNDAINGGDGLDTVHGGDGDDVIHMGDSNNYLFIERVWDGPGNDTVYGEGGEDYIYGSPGDDYYDGGTGGTQILQLDEVIYTAATAGIYVDMSLATGQVRSLAAGDAANIGTDTLVNVEAIWGSAFDDVMHGGSESVVFVGDLGDDIITGGAGADRILGGAGNDTMDGGDGYDTISFQLATGPIHVSLAITGPQDTGEGIDQITGFEAIEGSSTYSNVIIGSEAAEEISGGDAGDTLSGGGGNDGLYSGLGNDSLDGGTGADDMAGGDGDDVYIIDNSRDSVSEFEGGGTDTIISSLTWSLHEASPFGSDTYFAYVENLTLSGTAPINGTGNNLANRIVGNGAANRLSGLDSDDILNGAGGNDILDGGSGNDVMQGGTGSDRYYVDSSADTVIENSGEGTDTVYSSASFVLGANIEELILTGSAVSGTGNASNNRIVGNAADNTLDGGAGVDVTRGGLGDDTYYVDDSRDRAIENSGEGNDTVISSVTYFISGNIENLTLTGSAFRANGNSMDNHLLGTDADNILNGARGADVMTGGGGNDTYFVDNLGDTIIENSGGGNDRVYTTVSYTLGANVEDIFVRGAGSVDVTGNELDNSMRGNGANNVITGGAGLDRMTGGGGADTFVWHDGDFAGMGPGSADQIRDFSSLQGDRIDLSAVDANTTAGGDQGFAFIGSDGFHNVAGELRYDIVNGTTYVYGDTNGDGAADFMIRLDGNHTMSASDFGL